MFPSPMYVYSTSYVNKRTGGYAHMQPYKDSAQQATTTIWQQR